MNEGTEGIIVSKAALVALIGTALYPNPDDPGDLDLLGKPIWWPKFPRPNWVELNPQPLPPRGGIQPEPWRSVLLTRSLIDRLSGQLLFATLAGDDRFERAAESSRSELKVFLDEYCGTPPRWPWPWPWPQPRLWNRNPPEAIDLLLAGAQLQGAAGLRINRPLREVFAEAASQLLETGFRQLEAQVEGEAVPA